MQLTLGQRLRQLRERTGLSQLRAAKIFGVSNVQISRYESDTHNPDPTLLAKFAEYYEVSTDYLLGVGENRDKSPTVSRDKSPIELSVNRNMMEFQHDFTTHDPNVFPVGELRMIPIVAVIPCGEPLYTEDNVIGHFPVDTSIINLNGGEYVWLQAKGESMINANIYDGSLVLLRLQPEVQSGEIAAVCIDGESATLKRVFHVDGQVMLYPENPAYEKLTLDAHRVKIVGQFRGVFTPAK